MEQETRIGMRGLPEEDSHKLPYLLKWVMVDGLGPLRMAEADEPADFLLVDVEQETDPESVGRSGESGAREIPVAADPSNLPGDKEGLTYPIRVVDLQRCLKAASSSSGEAPVSPPTTAPSPRETTGTSGNPQPGPAATNVDRLVGPLLQPEGETTLRLEGADGLEIVVDPHRGFYTPHSPRDLAWIETDLSRAQWQPQSEGAVEDAVEWRPLRQLVWLLAYYGARDGLLPRIPRDRAFYLEAWPDYQVIPMAANNLKVWAYLKWNTADAATISEQAEVALGQVLGSLNAGYLCGQVRIAERMADAQEEAGGATNTSILSKIRDRLGLGSDDARESASCPKSS